MSKSLLTLVFIAFLSFAVSAQEETPANTEVDSLQSDLKEQGIVVVDTLKKKRVKINPLAPSKAAFYSAVIPGLGQVYNKRYWKVPIVYGAIGAAVYSYTWNNNNYQRFRTAFKRRRAGFTDDEFYANPSNPSNVPLLGLDDLQSQQERFQNQRDLLLLVSIALYALNIVDANVDAHLKQFNIDDDLSFDMQPFLDLDPVTNNPNYGMALIIKF
ncbi:hypothetical protein SAMN05421766_102440 [Zobellia uliginosa]|uniref:DUF5683 domain-containing protein n=1 Tax=Zobellia uliginosa TaxID=143224 RepID=A0ABY1KMR4_9FLAO|nr:DUF5683 domain-containing protein [Zobellia uliginosa]SIS50172.1 hypothetical protein SAMN05421766_102440 [Zobellia uliginosa]